MPSTSNGGRFQYTGQVWLEELGMNYYKARIYSPRLGRFMQTDPIGYEGGYNLYGYANNDPANLIDYTGLKPGDRFDTLEEAAEDWAQYVQTPGSKDSNGNDIAIDGFEYGSVISQTVNKDGSTSFSYNEPRQGTADTVPFGGTPTELDNAVGSAHNHNQGPDEPSSKQESTGSRIRRSNGVGGNSDQTASEALADRSNVSDRRTFTTYVLGKGPSGARPLRGFRFRRNKAREIDD